MTSWLYCVYSEKKCTVLSVCSHVHFFVHLWLTKFFIIFWTGHIFKPIDFYFWNNSRLCLISNNSWSNGQEWCKKRNEKNNNKLSSLMTLLQPVINTEKPRCGSSACGKVIFSVCLSVHRVYPKSCPMVLSYGPVWDISCVQDQWVLNSRPSSPDMTRG